MSADRVTKNPPPAVESAISILRGKGHQVEIRETKSGSLRYRVDGGRERNALQTINQFRHYGL
jgi:hypothetical protein